MFAILYPKKSVSCIAVYYVSVTYSMASEKSVILNSVFYYTRSLFLIVPVVFCIARNVLAILSSVLLFCEVYFVPKEICLLSCVKCFVS